VVTMGDVAREARVSVSTVSHVLNGTRYVEPSTLERVREVIDRLGYRHNQLARAVARGGRTQSVGVAISARSNPYFGDVVSAIDTAANALGSTMLLGETGDEVDREYSLINSLLERRVDGIILAPGPDAAERSLPLLQRATVASVLIDRLPAGWDLDAVGTENVEPTARLVDHLAAVHKHRRIGFLAGLAGLSTTTERIEGFRLGMSRNGLSEDPALVISGRSATSPATQATESLLELAEPPTAIIAGNNAMLVGMLRLLKQRRIKVPRDIAVCSFDDVEWAELLPSPITAVSQDWNVIGRTAVDLLEQRHRNPNRPAVIHRIPATLVIRHSCGCTGRTKYQPVPLS
jgi:LacI family transcriptional regulator